MYNLQQIAEEKDEMAIEPLHFDRLSATPVLPPNAPHKERGAGIRIWGIYANSNRLPRRKVLKYKHENLP